MNILVLSKTQIWHRLGAVVICCCMEKKPKSCQLTMKVYYFRVFVGRGIWVWLNGCHWPLAQVQIGLENQLHDHSHSCWQGLANLHPSSAHSCDSHPVGVSIGFLGILRTGQLVKRETEKTLARNVPERMLKTKAKVHL